MELLGACTVGEACGPESKLFCGEQIFLGMYFLSGGWAWAHSASSVISISYPCDTGVGER